MMVISGLIWLTCSINHWYPKPPDNFNTIEIIAIFQHLSEIDFNDSYYIELAKIGRLKIVTDDHDFIKCSQHNLEIITLSN